MRLSTTTAAIDRTVNAIKKANRCRKYWPSSLSNLSDQKGIEWSKCPFCATFRRYLAHQAGATGPPGERSIGRRRFGRNGSDILEYLHQIGKRMGCEDFQW